MRASHEARSPGLRRWVGVCLVIVGTMILGHLVLGRAWASARLGDTDAHAATSGSPTDSGAAFRGAAPREPAKVDPSPSAAPPAAPGWRTVRDAWTARGNADVRVIPPTSSGDEAPAVLTMLHGMTSSPKRTCARVASAAEAGMVVVCPTGNVDYGDGTADWAGDAGAKAAHIDRALTAALAPLSLAPAAERGDVLMGFSRGAFVARDIAYERPGRWAGLVLIGAALVPDAEKLRTSGIRRVVLASGDFDGAKRTMLAARGKLCAAGIPARFVSLGPVWHALPEDTMQRLEGALAWARGGGPAETPGCTPQKS